MRAVSTILVEPTTLFREGLGKLLMSAGFIVTGTASRAIDIEVGHPVGPQLAIIGTGYNDNDEDFADNLRTIQRKFHGSCLVVLAEQIFPEKVDAALRFSASGYLTKELSFSRLIEALDMILLGGRIFPSEILTKWDNDRASDADLNGSSSSYAEPNEVSLSHRETEILECLVKGQSNKVIALTLNIVEATVKIHIKAILRKIRVKNRTQAAIWGIKHPDFLRRTGGLRRKPDQGRGSGRRAPAP